MVIKDVPYELINWQGIEKTEVKGITEKAFWQTRKFSDIRLRIIEKMPGYRADHFCKKGHIIHMLEGEMVVELENGETFPVKAGQSVLLSDDPEFAHSTYTETGCKYFIID